ncbi:MAG TPA: hypothetical protein O0X27_05300 [Methanocorpusculum sp.]|nr:hypothetical protein [Methanocorpusculum sp.]
MITDVCLCIPGTAQSSVSELLAEAKRNGWNRFLVPSAEKSADVIPCIRVHAATTRELQNAVRGCARDAAVIVDAGENSFNRFALSQPKTAFLAGLENLPKNGFDHITAKLAADKNVGLVIELAAIIDYRRRKTALKSYADILALQRKYRFPLVIATGAETRFGIRSIPETVALCSLFGMTRAEVYAAISAPESVLHPHETVEVEP